MKKFALNHPLIMGIAVFIATTLVVFLAGYLYIAFVVEPGLLKTVDPKVPNDVAGMGMLAAFLAVVFGSLTTSFLTGLVISIILFVKRKGLIPIQIENDVLM